MNFNNPRNMAQWLIIAVIFVGLVACASTAPKPAAPPKPSAEEIKARVAAEIKQLEDGDEEPKTKTSSKPTYDIPITVNDQVERWIDYFSVKKPKMFRRWLERSGRYTPMMREILRDYGMPEDLVYLALIESGFNCSAYSRAHAVGPWQFIRGTGRRYNLKIDYWVDERRDPIKATHAAAKYLSELYAEFGSWYLAAAAYNAGEAKIRRALARYNADDYWEISHHRRRYLKLETKHYVPKMLAAAIIAKEPQKYGFGKIEYQKPLAYDKAVVDGGTSLAVAAKAAGVKTRVLRDLNPEIRRGVVPPNLPTYTLRIPKGSFAQFHTAYAKLTPKERKARPDIIVVRVESGQTLGGIARTYGVSLRDILALNSRLNPRRLSIGQRVMVPPGRYRTRAPDRTVRTASVRQPSRPAKTTLITHTVRRGETYWLIAKRYNVNWRNIKRWNKRRSSRLKLGQKLILYVPSSTARAAKAKPERVASATQKGARLYTVRPGDNLWLIAKRFKVTTDQIKRWNNMTTSRLKPGQRLVVGLKQSAKATVKTQISTAARTGGGSRTYTVRRGDNLWLIAQRFNVTPKQLRRWNNMSSSRLMPGDTLTIRPGNES